MSEDGTDKLFTEKKKLLRLSRIKRRFNREINASSQELEDLDHWLEAYHVQEALHKAWCEDRRTTQDQEGKDLLSKALPILSQLLEIKRFEADFKTKKILQPQQRPKKEKTKPRRRRGWPFQYTDEQWEEMSGRKANQKNLEAIRTRKAKARLTANPIAQMRIEEEKDRKREEENNVS